MTNLLAGLLLIAAILGKIAINTSPRGEARFTGLGQGALSFSVVVLLLLIVVRTANGLTP